MSGNRMLVKTTSNFGNVLIEPNRQGPLSAADVLKATRALDKVYHTFRRTGYERFDFKCLLGDCCLERTNFPLPAPIQGTNLATFASVVSCEILKESP